MAMKPDDNLPVFAWRARRDMSCEYVNRAWREFTGYTSGEGLDAGWTASIHPEDLPRWLQTCVRAYDERRPFEIDYRLRRRDGAYHWVHERAEPVFSGEGVFAGFAGAGRLRERAALAA